jgi:hypothetical protein
MTIREAKIILNRAGYRVTEHHDGDWCTWEKKDDVWKDNGKLIYTNNDFPGSLYEGIKNNLYLMRLTIYGNDLKGKDIEQALLDIEMSLKKNRIGTDSDIPHVKKWIQ